MWQTGLLTMKTCGEPAAGGCALCGMPLCMNHVVQGSRGPAGPGCASRTEGYAETEDTEIAGAREKYDAPYGGAAAFGAAGLGVAGLGAAAYFSQGDAAAMGAPGAMPFAQRKRNEDEDYDALDS
jgi:hypothetical protein